MPTRRLPSLESGSRLFGISGVARQDLTLDLCHKPSAMRLSQLQIATDTRVKSAVITGLRLSDADVTYLEYYRFAE